MAKAGFLMMWLISWHGASNLKLNSGGRLNDEYMIDTSEHFATDPNKTCEECWNDTLRKQLTHIFPGLSLGGNFGKKVSLNWLTSTCFELREKFKCKEHTGKPEILAKTSWILLNFSLFKRSRLSPVFHGSAALFFQGSAYRALFFTAQPRGLRNGEV